jgi:hypothetical protein
MKAIQITNPEYVGLLAEPLQKFAAKVNVPGVRYETLFTYFVESIRNGMIQKQLNGAELQEFWVVLDDEQQPVAFAHWFKRTVPFVATVELDYMFSWGAKGVATGLLADELIKFASRHRSPQIIGTAINAIVFNHLVKVAKQRGYEVINSQSIHFSVRKEK